MNGWISLAVLVAASMGVLWMLGIRGAVLHLSLAALLFGCAGYALQGRPGLAGAPRSSPRLEAPAPVTEIRHAFFGDFSPTEHWLLMSESFARRGSTEEAVGVLQSAVREHPRDASLWVGLGNALVDHAGSLTPASEFAYRHAAELAPGHPAPPFFIGLALARSGDRDAAIAVWKDLLARAPSNAGWRTPVADAIAALQPPPGRAGR